MVTQPPQYPGWSGLGIPGPSRNERLMTLTVAVAIVAVNFNRLDLARLVPEI